MRRLLVPLLIPIFAVGVAAQPPAEEVARQLAAQVRRTPNFRATYRGPAVWWARPDAVWSVRPDAECHAALRHAGVDFEPMRWTPTPVPTPVEVRGPVGGVRFEKTRPVPLYLSCEMALRLPHLAAVLRRHGIDRVDVMSALRREPRTSFHSAGLALDLSAFHGPAGTLSVEDHFTTTPDLPTCDAPPPADPRARTLLSIACDLARSARFSTVLTPNYGRGHHDHFHLDTRPDDPRVFVR